MAIFGLHSCQMDTLVPGLLLFITGLLGAAGQPSPVGQVCAADGSRCFTLYDNAGRIAWAAAYDACQDAGLRLAVSNSPVVQAVISGLMLAVPWESHAWMAGRRDTARSWVDIGETPFTGNIVRTVSSGRCVTMDSHSYKLESRLCHGPGDNKQSFNFLCQYPQVNGQCASSGTTPPLSHGGLCHKLPVYDDPEIEAHEEAIYNWNDAHQFCQDTYGGSLAYRYIDTPQIQAYVTRAMTGKYTDSIPVWVGVRRQQWMWIRDSGEEPVTYTSWRLQEGADTGETCLHLDLNVNADWADKHCTDPSRYHVCESGRNDPLPTVVPTTPYTTPSTPSTTMPTTKSTTPATTPTTPTTPSTTPTTPTTPSTTRTIPTTPATTPSTTPTTPTTKPTTPTTPTTPSTEPSTTRPATPATTLSTTPSTTNTPTTTALLATPVAGTAQPSASRPFIDTLTPRYGPVAGGTRLTISGDKFVSAPREVLLGPTISCAIEQYDLRMITAITPRVLARNVEEVFYLIVTFADNTTLTTRIGFQFKINPLITALSPNNTIKEGGTTLTVSGRNFLSIYGPKLHIGLNLTENMLKNADQLRSMNPVYNYMGDCNVRSNLEMVCLVPRLDVLADGAVVRECPSCLPLVDVSFALDGVPEELYFSGVPLTDRQLVIMRSPEFDVADQHYEFETKQVISLAGRHVDSVALSDYRVEVQADGICEVQVRSEDALFCLPPQSEPSKTGGESAHSIIVYAGANLQFKVGVLKYPSGLPLQVIIGIAIACLVLVVLIILTVVCVIKARKKRSVFKSKPLENDYNEVDWPYEQRMHLPPPRPELEDGLSTTASKYRSAVGSNLRVGGGTWRSGAGTNKGDTVASRASSAGGGLGRAKSTTGTVASRTSSRIQAQSEHDSGMSAEGDERLSDINLEDGDKQFQPVW